MKLKSLLALALVAGVVASSLATADAAKRRKIVKWIPQESTLFQRNETDNCNAPNYFLSKTDGEDLDCNYLNHFVWPALGFVPAAYPATDGVPFILDAKKAITGVITMRSANGVGAGSASVTVQLVGETGGEEVAIGEFVGEYDAAPNGTYTFEYEIDSDNALNRKKFTSLTMTVTPDGQTVGNPAVIEHDEPPAQIVLPTLKKKVIRR
jgi:hypothetical protein